MRTSARAILAAAFVTAFAANLAHAQATFQGVGFLSNIEGSLANAISADGTTVVGESVAVHGRNAQYRAFRWRADTGIVELGVLPGGNAESVAYGVSADGAVVVGQADDGTFEEGGTPFRWDATRGIEAIFPDEYGWANSVTADGATIIGSTPLLDGNFNSRAFKWTRATGAQPFTPNGVLVQSAVINAAGTLAWGNSTTQPYKWTPTGGWSLMPSSFHRIGWLRDDEQAAAVVRCFNGAPVCPRAYRWTSAGGFSDLGIVHGSSERGDTGIAGISQDGSIIVGNANFDPNDGGVAYIWDTTHGMRPLQDVLLQNYQLFEVVMWDDLEVTGLSADGLVICGTGFDVNGSQQGWIANLRGATPVNPCGSQDYDNDGDTGTDRDIEAFFACLSGNCCQTCPTNADFDGDGDVGTDRDIEAFFRVLAGGTC